MEIKQILQPIGIDSQIEDALYGIKHHQQEEEKIKIVTENIDKIKKINGSNVYDVIIDEDFKNLYYNLRPTPNEFKRLFSTIGGTTQFTRKYYYPIKFAEIEF